jgi:16S rRNA G966 N2-methylase RsmD
MASTVRITGGFLAGRTFAAKSVHWVVRPSTDLARQGLMNHLETRLDWIQTRTLDLFAGTGSLGLECLSRGAPELVSLDLHPEALGHLRQLRGHWNLKNWSIAGADLLGSGTARADSIPWRWTERSAESRGIDRPFQLILADPPYGEPRLEGLADRLLEGSLLSPEGILVVEHAVTYRRIALSCLPDRVLTYGQSQFSIFEKSTSAP